MKKDPSTSIQLQIGSKVRKLRTKLGMTQEGLAEIAGIDYKYIQKIEGKNPPNLKVETIEKLAKALKTTPAELLKF